MGKYVLNESLNSGGNGGELKLRNLFKDAPNIFSGNQIHSFEDHGKQNDSRYLRSTDSSRAVANPADVGLGKRKEPLHRAISNFEDEFQNELMFNEMNIKIEDVPRPRHESPIRVHRGDLQSQLKVRRPTGREGTNTRRKRGKYRKYEQNVKERAIDLVTKEGILPGDAAKLLKIPQKNLKRWIMSGPVRKKGKK